MTPTAAVLIVAAGRGSRMGGETPKQYRVLGGRSVLTRAVSAFEEHPGISSILVAIGHGDEEAYQRALPGGTNGKLLAPVQGGASRQASVRAGLEALAGHRPDLILIHDAARPFVSAALIDRALAAALGGPAVPAVPVKDTIVASGPESEVETTLARDALRAVQTPQAFPFALLHEAHAWAEREGRQDFTDDGGLAQACGHRIRLFEGDEANVKLTTPDDFERAEARLRGTGRPALVSRVATGYDVHALVPGDRVHLGGVAIPHDHALDGHSDADVVLHALTDALLGTIADGDIGVHFPPSDAQWRGASSDRFLAFAAERVRGRGGVIDHLDVMLLCEAPRVGPHREAMRARIGEVAGVPAGRVSIKATTSEKLGFVGRHEGIAALATASVRLSEDETDVR